MNGNSTDFWNQKHEKYAISDWIVKPTIFLNQVIKYFPYKGKVLELGCGQGADAIFLASKGYSVEANDFSQTAIDYAIKQTPGSLRNLINYYVFDLNNKLYFENKFDVVYSHLSLHFFTEERTKQLMDEVYTSLKPGGIFSILLNSISDPETKLYKKIGDDYFIDADGQTKRYFSTGSLKQYISKFDTLLLDDKGGTWKDKIKGVHGLIRFVGRKQN